MKVTKLESRPLDNGTIEVDMEVSDDEKTRNFKATGETLLGAIGNCFCEMLDADLGEIKNERALANAVKGPFGEELVTLRIIAEHEGKEKEVLHSGKGILETVVKALKDLHYK